jgi:hypothetical protein
VTRTGQACGREKEEACTRRASADDGFTASRRGLSGRGFLNEAATGTAFASWRLNGWVRGVFWGIHGLRAGAATGLEKSEQRGVQAARNGPSADGKCWQRVELGTHGLNR